MVDDKSVETILLAVEENHPASTHNLEMMVRLKKCTKLLICYVMAFCLVVIYLIQKGQTPFGVDPNKVVRHHQSKSNSSTKELYEIMSRQYDVPLGLYEGKPYKKILYWNRADTLYHQESYGLGVGRDVYQKAGCPVWQCETSEDRRNLSDYDVVLFRLHTFDEKDLPKERLPHQRYVLFEFEAPFWHKRQHLGPLPKEMDGFFNWTMTYRWDSDVVHPYSWIEPKNSLNVPLHPSEEDVKQLINRPENKKNFSAGKKRMAAWFNSHCQAQSGRDVFVKQLIESGIQVDIYGACGNYTCGNRFDNKTDESDEYCRRMAAKDYKFYLALENALCLDYITEKFFAMMRHPIILVVLDAHGHYAKAAPPHSYINALDFPSTRELADYLLKLDADDELYNQYFWWKDHFHVRNSLLSGMFYRTFCSLCAVLHNPSHLQSHHVYSDMNAWWRDMAKCRGGKI